ncbi:MAG: 1-acyl-sn-glycerol-3-phosphate acyltransferase [Cyanobacteria bacterium P01_A01_bin.84]
MIPIDSAFKSCHPRPTKMPFTNEVAHITNGVSPWLSPIAYTLGRHLLMPLFFGSVQVFGQENIPKSGPVIIAPTHRSRWDALVVPYVAGRCVTGRDLRFMVTSTECRGLQGWFVQRMGGFPIDPKRPSIKTLRYGVELLKQGEALVIFPEGGIFRDGEIHSLKPGIARLALGAQSSNPGLDVNVLPISISYSTPYPRWGTDVRVDIGSVISAKKFTNGCPKKNAKYLTASLGKALQKLSNRQVEISAHGFAQIPNS